MKPGLHAGLLVCQAGGKKRGKAAPRICHGGILKPFCRLREALPKQNLIKLAYIGQRDSIMWAFIEELYRDYCLTRVLEIRKFELSH